jgi:hypothetical protein
MSGGEERPQRLDNVLFHERSDEHNKTTRKETSILSTDPFKAFDNLFFVLRKESISFPRED